MSIGATLKSGFGKAVIKGVGAAGGFFACRDAHAMGKYNADANAKTKISKNTEDLFVNSTFLDSPSLTDAKLKKSVLNWQLDEGLQEFVYSATGYVKGFFKMLSDKIVPFTLGLGALLGGKKIGKGSAIGLAVYGAYKFITVGLGIGRKTDL